MNTKNGYIPALNQSLKIFFKDAILITVRRPSQALHFIKTVWWQQCAVKRRTRWAKEGIHVPPIIIFSITHRCNLKCKGCYSRALNRTADEELSTKELQRIIHESHELGTSFYVVAGGEPLVRREIMDISRQYPDIIFLIFTNGLLIDDNMIQIFKKQKNTIPVISMEGQETETDQRRGNGIFQRLEILVERLQKEQIFFSISVTVSRLNLKTVTDERFVQRMIARGCKLFFFLEYTAIRQGTEQWVPTESDRTDLNQAVNTFRDKYPALFISVPGDEKQFGGCLSSGRGFVHITADGDLEPCPFAPFSDTNLKKLPLKDALQSPLLSIIRENAEALEEGQGGCTLWQKRKWVQSLLLQDEKKISASP